MNPVSSRKIELLLNIENGAGVSKCGVSHRRWFRYISTHKQANRVEQSLYDSTFNLLGQQNALHTHQRLTSARTDTRTLEASLNRTTLTLHAVYYALDHTQTHFFNVFYNLHKGHHHEIN